MRLWMSALILSVLGCGSSERAGDAGTSPADARAPDAAVADAGPADAGAADAGEAGLPTACEGACRTLDASIDISGSQGGFQRAFYGLTAPAASSTGGWTVHVEVTSGGPEGCPTESSPAPDWNLIVSALPLPTTEAPDSSASVSFLDFSGQFLDVVPVTRATAATVTARAANLCPDCLGMPAPSHAEGRLAFDLSATFAEGEISGRVFATHCDSLDVRE